MLFVELKLPEAKILSKQYDEEQKSLTSRQKPDLCPFSESKFVGSFKRKTRLLTG